jgi:mannose-6-phosphate isomerase-like protein (cupin superfamily)
MRSSILALLPLCLLSVSTFAADPPAKVEYRKAAEVDAMRASGDTGGVIITDADFRVLAGRRDKPGQSEVHATDTDIFIVIGGSATIVVGGEMIDAHENAPGETRGSGIKGGTDYLLEPGVLLTIPRGTPHWVRDTKPGFRYYVVKSVARR